MANSGKKAFWFQVLWRQCGENGEIRRDLEFQSYREKVFAENEHEARRRVFEKYANRGHQVRSIESSLAAEA